MNNESALRIKTLRTIGSTQPARLVAAVVQDVNPADAQDGLAFVADLCAVAPFTVYRWILGAHAPRERQLRRIVAEAARRGVEAVLAAEPAPDAAADAAAETPSVA